MSQKWPNLVWAEKWPPPVVEAPQAPAPTLVHPCFLLEKCLQTVLVAESRRTKKIFFIWLKNLFLWECRAYGQLLLLFQSSLNSTFTTIKFNLYWKWKWKLNKTENYFQFWPRQYYLSLAVLEVDVKPKTHEKVDSNNLPIYRTAECHSMLTVKKC